MSQPTETSRPRRKKMRERIQTPFFRHFVLPLTWGMYRAMVAFVDRLTPRQAYVVGGGLAWIFWFASPQHRLRAIRNVEIAYRDRFSPRERRRIAFGVVRSFFLTMMDILLIPRLARGEVDWRSVVSASDDTWAKLSELMAHRGPVAFHTAHFGSWEMAAACAGMLGGKLNFVYRAVEHPQIDAELRAHRTAFGGTVFEKKGAMRTYARIMKEAGWLGVISDQNAGRSAAFVDFFGVPASTETSHFVLYQRFRPRIVVVLCRREEDEFRFRLLGPFEATIDPDADETAESLRLARWYMECIERAASEHPDQYLWTHKRYTSRPAGAPSLYDSLGSPLDPAVLAAQPKAPIPPQRAAR